MTNIEENIIPEETCLSEVILTLDKVAKKILFVTDKNNKLIGTITDGDIRRALIKHLSLDSLSKDFMNSTPVIIDYEDSNKSHKKIMQERGIKFIPITNNGVIVGIESLDEELDIFANYQDIPVFLMAGGFGKRLMPLTKTTPKPLLNIGGKPIIENLILQLKKYGFKQFFVSVHYKAEMLKNFLGDGSKYDINIVYIEEDQPLGTAGSLGFLKGKLSFENILLMNGDLLTKVDFGELVISHLETANIATICVREYEFKVPYGVIEVEDNLVKNIIEKPIHEFFINAGIYLLNKNIFLKIEKNKYLDMPDLLQDCIKEGNKVNIFPIHEYWIDIGQIDQFKQAELDFQDERD